MLKSLNHKGVLMKRLLFLAVIIVPRLIFSTTHITQVINNTDHLLVIRNQSPEYKTAKVLESRYIGNLENKNVYAMNVTTKPDSIIFDRNSISTVSGITIPKLRSMSGNMLLLSFVVFPHEKLYDQNPFGSIAQVRGVIRYSYHQAIFFNQINLSDNAVPSKTYTLEINKLKEKIYIPSSKHDNKLIVAKDALDIRLYENTIPVAQ